MSARLGGDGSVAPFHGHPGAGAPEVVAACQWLADSGFADDITITSAGRLTCYGVEFDPAVLMAMGDDEALDLLLQATIRAELGDDPEADAD